MFDSEGIALFHLVVHQKAEYTDFSPGGHLHKYVKDDLPYLHYACRRLRTVGVVAFYMRKMIPSVPRPEGSLMTTLYILLCWGHLKRMLFLDLPE